MKTECGTIENDFATRLKIDAAHQQALCRESRLPERRNRRTGSDGTIRRKRTNKS